MTTQSDRRELFIARACVAVSIIISVGLFRYLYLRGAEFYHAKDMRSVAQTVLFGTVMFFMTYGSLLYQICVAGYYKRKLKHRPASRAQLEAVYGGDAPKLAILIPSYKEERKVIWQTMVSAALSEYPEKDVVLLIDDPQNPKSVEDVRLLSDARSIPQELQHRFAAPLGRFQAELEAFEARKVPGQGLCRRRAEPPVAAV